jgi:outer membrane protein assembly factor BamB
MAKGIFLKLMFTLFVAASFAFSDAPSWHERHSIDLVSFDTIRPIHFADSISDTSAVRSFVADENSFLTDSSYTLLKGITTFRGGPWRNSASYGVIEKRPDSLKISWSFNTASTGEWGGGAGWTGQPSVVQWPDSVRKIMNLNEDVKTKPDFAEVVFGSLDGNIYFLDLETGKPSRKAINIKNPIKGSVSIDPRGFPLLYCGQGIPETKVIGFRIFSLTDQKVLHFINGIDPFALRGWGAFDGACLINRKTDMLHLGGENGILYALKLNTKFDSTGTKISVSPKALKYRYNSGYKNQKGIENSVVLFQDKVYHADNSGYIQCFSLKTFQSLWIVHNEDDTDASLVLKPENGIPFLYTGSEVDKQGDKGFSFIKKINGVTGETVWERKFECRSVLGAHPVNGGMLATPLIGKMKADQTIVITLSRYKSMQKGLIVALDQKTGKTIYETSLDNYSWSSPVDIYDKGGNMYIFQADSKGYVMLLDGENGKLIYKKKVADLFEASPVVFNNKIIIPSRPRTVFCFEII